MVEGQGGRVGLVYIGFRPGDLIRHGLSEVLAGDTAIELPRGHDHSGSEQQPLDLRALHNWAEAQTGVSAFAMAGSLPSTIRRMKKRPASLSARSRESWPARRISYPRS